VQKGGSLLYVANALRGRISNTYHGYSWRWICLICAYHRRTLVDCCTTHSSVEHKVTATFYKIGGIFNAEQGFFLLRKGGRYAKLTTHSTLFRG